MVDRLVKLQAFCYKVQRDSGDNPSGEPVKFKIPGAAHVFWVLSKQKLDENNQPIFEMDINNQSTPIFEDVVENSYQLHGLAFNKPRFDKLSDIEKSIYVSQGIQEPSGKTSKLVATTNGHGRIGLHKEYMEIKDAFKGKYPKEKDFMPKWEKCIHAINLINAKNMDYSLGNPIKFEKGINCQSAFATFGKIMELEYLPGFHGTWKIGRENLLLDDEEINSLNN